MLEHPRYHDDVNKGFAKGHEITFQIGKFSKITPFQKIS